MVQIVGIAFLDKLDHYIKEKLKIKQYVRYMDDSIIIYQSKEYLEECLEKIKIELAKIGLEVNPKKTRIYKISDRIPFLGFNFRLTSTGKVIITLKKDYIKRQKRHIRNLVRACKNGKITKAKVDECYQSIIAYISKGNTYYYRQKLNKFYKSLWKGGNECKMEL